MKKTDYYNLMILDCYKFWRILLALPLSKIKKLWKHNITKANEKWSSSCNLTGVVVCPDMLADSYQSNTHNQINPSGLLRPIRLRCVISIKVQQLLFWHTLWIQHDWKQIWISGYNLLLNLFSRYMLDSFSFVKEKLFWI